VESRLIVLEVSVASLSVYTTLKRVMKLCHFGNGRGPLLSWA